MLGGVHDAVRAEAGNRLEDRRSGEALLPQPLEQGLREGAVVPCVGFADEDPDQDLFAVENAHDESS
jgi:hypothetical protein